MRYLHLIWAALTRRKARTVFTLLSVIAAFLLFGMLESVNSVFTQGGHIIGAAHRLVTESKMGIMAQLPESLEAGIRAVPGVEDVTSSTFVGGTYQTPKNFIGVVAVEHNYFDVNPEHVMVSAAARRAFDDTQTGAIVGAAMARRFHWKVGEQIPIKAMIYPRKNGSYVWTFSLVGLYHARAPSQEQGFLFRWRYLDLSRSFSNGTVGWYTEKIDDPKQAGRIAAQIDALSDNSDHETKTQSESAFAANFYSQYLDSGMIVHAIMAAVFFTLVLLTGNTLAQAARERIPEIGILKTLGYSNVSVLALVLGESVLLVVVGGVVGLLLAGAAISVLQGQVGSQLPMMPVGAAIWLRGLAVMVAIGLLVGALPARRGMRLRIVDALAGR